MGATGSRSTETQLLKIEEYSKLTRAPVRSHRRDLIRFRELWWVTVSSTRFSEETGLSESLHVAVFFDSQCSPESALDISIEILDYTGLYTVFQRESGRHPTSLVLTVQRRELEASSCLRPDDSFYVRFTVKEQRRPKVLRECDMAWGHRLTVSSLSETKAALLSSEFHHSVYSTRFDVGGSGWYLKLCPALAVVRLVRAIKDDDETRMTAEFGFALEGAVNVQSEKMTHTFDHHSPDCPFEFLMPPEGPTPTTSSTDGLVVRCYVRVFRDAVVPTAVPSRAAISTTIPTTSAESLLTPLLSIMDNGGL